MLVGKDFVLKEAFFQFNFYSHLFEIHYIFYGKKINMRSIIFKWFYLLGKKCVLAKGARLSCWPLPLCSYKNGVGGGGSRIYKTDCRALLIKLGLGEENTSVREKRVFTANK